MSDGKGGLPAPSVRWSWGQFYCVVGGHPNGWLELSREECLDGFRQAAGHLPRDDVQAFNVLIGNTWSAIAAVLFEDRVTDVDPLPVLSGIAALADSRPELGRRPILQAQRMAASLVGQPTLAKSNLNPAQWHVLLGGHPPTSYELNEWEVRWPEGDMRAAIRAADRPLNTGVGAGDVVLEVLETMGHDYRIANPHETQAARLAVWLPSQARMWPGASLTTMIDALATALSAFPPDRLPGWWADTGKRVEELAAARYVTPRDRASIAALRGVPTPAQLRESECNRYGRLDAWTWSPADVLDAGFGDALHTALRHAKLNRAVPPIELDWLMTVTPRYLTNSAEVTAFVRLLDTVARAPDPIGREVVLHHVVNIGKNLRHAPAPVDVAALAWAGIGIVLGDLPLVLIEFADTGDAKVRRAEGPRVEITLPRTVGGVSVEAQATEMRRRMTGHHLGA